VPIEERVYKEWNLNEEGESNLEDYLGSTHGGFSSEGDDVEDDDIVEKAAKGQSKLLRVADGERFERLSRVYRQH
jgi:hypothetical protein